MIWHGNELRKSNEIWTKIGTILANEKKCNRRSIWIKNNDVIEAKEILVLDKKNEWGVFWKIENLGNGYAIGKEK